MLQPQIELFGMTFLAPSFTPLYVKKVNKGTMFTFETNAKTLFFFFGISIAQNARTLGNVNDRASPVKAVHRIRTVDMEARPSRRRDLSPSCANRTKPVLDTLTLSIDLRVDFSIRACDRCQPHLVLLPSCVFTRHGSLSRDTGGSRILKRGGGARRG